MTDISFIPDRLLKQIASGHRGAPFHIATIPGGGGGGSDVAYVHDQTIAAASWVVVHNLGKFPSVTVVDSAGTRGEAGVVYDSANQLTITVASAMSGKAYLN